MRLSEYLCLQRTVLAWIPAAILLLLGAIELSENRKGKNSKIPLNVFNLTKIGATLGRIKGAWNADMAGITSSAQLPIS